jgi:hypothetical protein
MAEIDSVEAACALHWPAVDRKHNCVTLLQRHHRGTRLHARALLSEHELTTLEIFPRFAEENRHLERENMLAIAILMQAVVIILAVLQQQWGRAGLPGSMAPFDELGMGCRETHVHPH